jgi:Cupin-like domain
MATATSTPFPWMDWVTTTTTTTPSFSSTGRMARQPGVCGAVEEEESAPWADLSEDRQSYYAGFGWDEERWESVPDDREVSYEPFRPRVVRALSVPALQDIGFAELGRLLASHQVMLREGTLVGDDEYPPRQYVPMQEFLAEVQSGSTRHYLKYDPEDESWKESIEAGLGVGVLGSLFDALEPLGLLPGRPCRAGGARQHPAGYGWTFWVGAANTSTGMHYDDEDFGFLYVTAGRKRVVMLPNDYRTANYTCETYIEGHSCWTGIDILSGPLPAHAVEFEVGPGEGIVIPTLAWHAVQNLEPTVAFGMLLDDDDFCR